MLLCKYLRMEFSGCKFSCSRQWGLCFRQGTREKGKQGFKESGIHMNFQSEFWYKMTQDVLHLIIYQHWNQIKMTVIKDLMNKSKGRFFEEINKTFDKSRENKKMQILRNINCQTWLKKTQKNWGDQHLWKKLENYVKESSLWKKALGPDTFHVTLL